MQAAGTWNAGNGMARMRKAKHGLAALAIGTLGVGVLASNFGAASGLGADPDNAAQVVRGKQIYAARCAACHGAKLEGQQNWRERRPDGKLPAPPHDASGHTWHHPDDQLFLITKHGTAAIAGPDYKTDMREFGSLLSDDDILATLAYIKSTWPADIQARHKRMNELRRATSVPKVSPPQK